MNSEVAAAVADLELPAEVPTAIVDALPLLGEIVPPLVAGFYDHLRETNERLFERAVHTRLLPAVSDHLTSLFAEGIDENYLRRVMRIGLAHRERGITPAMHLRGYGWLTSRLVRELMDRSPADRRHLADLVDAVLKLMFFDMTMVIRAHDAALLD